MNDESHERKCWDCGNVAIHAKAITPEVLCSKCGSQDTRRTYRAGAPTSISLEELKRQRDTLLEACLSALKFNENPTLEPGLSDDIASQLKTAVDAAMKTGGPK